MSPDVAVIDIGMPSLNGLDAGRRLKKLMPKIKVIYLTMNEVLRWRMKRFALAHPVMY